MRFRTLLVTAGFVLAGVLGVASPASATLGVNDYPSNLATAAQDTVVDPWNFYNRECTSFVAWRLNHDNGFGFTNNMSGGHFGNAYEWKDNAIDLFGASVYNGTPARGSVAWWDSNHGDALSMGHVAYVDSVNSNGSINVEQYNTWHNPGGYWKETITTTSYNWPSGFLHIADDSLNNGEGQLLWKLRNSKSAGMADASFYYGPDTGTPVVGDWDGSGSESIGVVRNNGAGELLWQLRNSNSDGDPSVTTTYGASTDRPIVGNWDGVGTTTVGIVRNDGSGQLLWKPSNNNVTAFTSFYYGASTDTVIAGDWDGNGTVTPGIVRKDTASGQLLWKLRNSNSAGSADITFYYGAITATPVPGDWDGNGTVTAGVVRDDDGSGQLLWQLRNSNSGGAAESEFHYGASTDTAVAGGWGGAGAMNIGIVRR